MDTKNYKSKYLLYKAKYLKLKKIEHILNINSLITICEFVIK